MFDKKAYMKWYNKKYKREHKKETSDYDKQYKETHREEHKTYMKEYHKTHKKQEQKYRQRPEVKIEQEISDKKFWGSPKGKKLNSKRISKRQKNLGFIVLWEPELETELMNFHHITKDFVVSIPEELHNSVRHNVWTGKGMTEINQKVFDYIARVSK